MIIVPTFNDDYIFGAAVRMNTGDPPREKQINKFFQVDGVECLDAGMGFRETVAQGRFFALDPITLGALMRYFANYKDGNGYTLLTTKGIYWPNTLLDEFTETSKISYDPWTGEFIQDYRAKFLHLSGPL